MIIMDAKPSGKEIYQLIETPYPICRSITGNRFHEMMKILRNHIRLNLTEIPTGTKVFDWTAPKESNIRDAYIKNLNGEESVDLEKSTMSILNYSVR
jgi:aminopeptidase-like protein